MKLNRFELCIKENNSSIYIDYFYITKLYIEDKLESHWLWSLLMNSADKIIIISKIKNKLKINILI